MTKAEKAPARQTELDRLATRLRSALKRETTNVIEIGELLLAIRKQHVHGEWQDWLAKHFDLSYRSAARYMAAAEYVARQGKSDTVALFTNLSPTVLYALAGGSYSEQEAAAILAATHKGRVDGTHAEEFVFPIRPKPPKKPKPPPDDDDPVAAAEAAAILDGPPPAVPPPAPIMAPPDFALQAFDQMATALKQLSTKPAAKFADSVNSAGDLEDIDLFIRAVMKAKAGDPATKPKLPSHVPETLNDNVLDLDKVEAAVRVFRGLTTPERREVKRRLQQPADADVVEY
jgi:Protein of unknown function (DUF3102)